MNLHLLLQTIWQIITHFGHMGDHWRKHIKLHFLQTYVWPPLTDLHFNLICVASGCVGWLGTGCVSISISNSSTSFVFLVVVLVIWVTINFCNSVWADCPNNHRYQEPDQLAPSSANICMTYQFDKSTLMDTNLWKTPPWGMPNGMSVLGTSTIKSATSTLYVWVWAQCPRPTMKHQHVLNPLFLQTHAHQEADQLAPSSANICLVGVWYIHIYIYAYLFGPFQSALGLVKVVDQLL